VHDRVAALLRFIDNMGNLPLLTVGDIITHIIK
jgi:hypothetical protein